MSAIATTPPSLDPANRGHILQNVAIALIVLDVAFVALRIYTRAMKGLRGRLDEWLVILGLLCNIGLAIEAILMYKRANIGHHLPWVKAYAPLSLITYAKLQVAFEFTFALGFTFPKLAILCLYLNIFVEPWHRRANYVLIGFVIATGLGTAITTVVQCIPLQYLWDKKGHPDGHCIDPNTFWRYSTLPNIPIDAAMFLLPLPCIWKLHLSWRDKVGLAVTFMTGSVGIFTCVVRMVILFETGKTDSTWNAVKFGSLTMLEASTYLMAACLPLYRPLFQGVRKRIGQTIGNTMSRTGGSRGTKKGSDDSELQSIRQPAFNENGFERLDDSNRKTIVTSQKHDFDSHAYEEASSIESGLDRRSRSGIQVKKEFMVATVNSRN